MSRLSAAGFLTDSAPAKMTVSRPVKQSQKGPAVKKLFLSINNSPRGTNRNIKARTGAELGKPASS